MNYGCNMQIHTTGINTGEIPPKLIVAYKEEVE
jgi:hypothetical protein